MLSPLSAPSSRRPAAADPQPACPFAQTVGRVRSPSLSVGRSVVRSLARRAGQLPRRARFVALFRQLLSLFQMEYVRLLSRVACPHAASAKRHSRRWQCGREVYAAVTGIGWLQATLFERSSFRVEAKMIHFTFVEMSAYKEADNNSSFPVNCRARSAEREKRVQTVDIVTT